MPAGNEHTPRTVGGRNALTAFLKFSSEEVTAAFIDFAPSVVHEAVVMPGEAHLVARKYTIKPPSGRRPGREEPAAPPAPL